MTHLLNFAALLLPKHSANSAQTLLMAWLAEWPNYAEYNKCRMTQRNKWNWKACTCLCRTFFWRQFEGATALQSVYYCTLECHEKANWQWKIKYPVSGRFSLAWLLSLPKSFAWLVSHIAGLRYTPLWNWDLWKSHGNNLKIPWTSFQGQWILQNNFSWSHLWPLNFRGKKVKRVSWRMKYNIELGYFHGSWISNETPHYENIPWKFNDGAMKNVKWVMK